MGQSLQDYTTRDLVVARTNESLEEAYALLRAKDVRHLPVLDERDSVVGIISERDFFRAMKMSPGESGAGISERPEFVPEMRVRDFMSWPVAAIEENQPIAVAAREMLDKKISALLVVHKGQVVGIVTSDDLLRVILTETENQRHHLGTDVKAALYTSPIGQIAHNLSMAGV